MMVRTETDKERLYLFLADWRAANYLSQEEDIHELYMRWLLRKQN